MPAAVQQHIPYSFLDDYSEAAHPALLSALLTSSTTQQSSYGQDTLSSDARRLLREQIALNDSQVDIHFVPSGTAANLICIAACLRPYEAVLTPETGHIVGKEAGAIEVAAGHKTIIVPGTVRGKMVPEQLVRTVQRNQFFPHAAKPRLVYISNATELGTVYSKSELRELSAVCKQLGLLLMVDGARIGVAVASVAHPEDERPSLADIAELTDIFWIGGTKMGALLGEAVVVKKTLPYADDFVFHVKQHGALLAKSRVMGCQFAELFRDGLFFQLARHANDMALRLAHNFVELGYALYPDDRVETNQVFVLLPEELILDLRERFQFYVWDTLEDGRSVVRVVTSWATDPMEVDKFNAFVRQWTI
ncbi:putative threonine aldolase [Aspergillus taichungensis]|uniref:Putative threonine aldolase n=1 Tax=Aspergillus taichungensis TaxID=482145 RepID=A0A2J5HPC3_9EURO|nr:putative threonine aldolase [Aspergillus taichungensis]